MQTLTEHLLASSLPDVFADADVASLLGFPTSPRRYALVKRALAAGELIRVRRGLYVLAERFRSRPLDLLSLAARIYGPSYISLESALAQHDLIPEYVAVTTSSTFRRSRTFDTTLGRFEFRRTPLPTLAGVQRVEPAASAPYLLASPLRALVDLAHDRPGVEMDLDYLVESLRIDPPTLRKIGRQEFAALAKRLPRGRAATFLGRLRRELGK